MGEINDRVKMDALDIEDELFAAIEEAGANGIGIADGSRITGVTYGRFDYLVRELERMGRVKVVRITGNSKRILLPGWEEPKPADLCNRQAEVLAFLISQMDENHLVRMSYLKIAKAIGVKHPVVDAIYSLDRHGYLEMVERGDHHRANLYHIYPNQDGPNGYSWIPANEH